MKSKLSFILLVLCALLTLSACQTTQAPEAPAPAVPPPEATEPEAPSEPEPEPVLPQREREMIEDIEFLRETYKEEHRDPFALCSEEVFDWRLDQLKAKVSELSDIDFYYELRAVLAGMGDNHTYIDPSEALSAQIYGRRFPVWFQSIGGRLYPLCYLMGYEQFAPCLLREVVAVNGIDVAYLEKKMMDMLSPFNHWYSKEQWGQMLTTPAFLDWAGCDYKEGYTFQILNDNQEVESIEVPIITSAEADTDAWVYPENYGLTAIWPGDWSKYVEGENGGYIYFQYSTLGNWSKEIVDAFDAAGALIEEHPECRKLVIDLRAHSGGVFDRLPQVRDSAKQLAAPSIEQTYVVTGGSTMSAAIDCLAVFEDALNNVTVIGEPTGQFHIYHMTYFNVDEYALPNSQHVLKTSRDWHEAGTGAEAYYNEDGDLYPWENTILPDVYIHQEIEDVRQGKDSVIEWVLAQ